MSSKVVEFQRGSGKAIQHINFCWSIHVQQAFGMTFDSECVCSSAACSILLEVNLIHVLMAKCIFPSPVFVFPETQSICMLMHQAAHNP